MYINEGRKVIYLVIFVFRLGDLFLDSWFLALLCFSASLLLRFLLPCFCFFAFPFLLLCFSAFALFASLLFCFSALHVCFSACLLL